MIQDNPQLLQEVRSIYQRVIGVMLDFTDIKDLEKVVHPNFTGYGTAAHEFFKTRQDLKKMAQIQKDQLEGQGFRYERKLISEKIFADGTCCLILEEFDLFFPGMDHHLLLRLSSLLERIDGEWLVTHVHGSTPDSNIAEEEAFPEQGLRRKNEELEAKIRERTRELEIEAALERTRAQSLLMQHSSELNEVSKTFHEQLQALGIASEFSFVWLPNETAGDHLFWTTWTEPAKKGSQTHTRAITYPLDKSEPYTAACFVDWQSGIPVHQHFVQPEAVETFFAAWEELLRGASKLKPDNFPEGIYYTEAFIKYGCFGIDTREPLTEEEKSILHRFAIEFERTYSRFLELKKVEAQAREAEVEAALERVRSASMAMQKTGDISDVAVVFLQQLKELKINYLQAWINVFHLEERFINIWFSPLEGVYDEPANWQLPISLFEETTLKSWKAGHSFSYLSLETKEEVDALVQACDEATGSDYFSHFQKILKLERLEFVDANYKFGTVSKSGFEKATKEEEDILHRFAKVFEQAYIRFLDLQRAEAQAREAEIELALERVRASTMAMQQSGELKDVIRVIFNQLSELKINAEHAGIVVDYAPGQDWHFWVAETQDLPAKITVPYLGSIWDKQFREAKEKGAGFFTTELGFEEKNVFYENLLDHIPGLTKDTRQFYLTCPGLAISTVVQEDIGLYIENFSGAPYSEEDNAILMRFGNVFQQTYTRFLDLQKAEEQAREAQIELGLERVRTRAMAMQNSSELSDLVDTVFQELTKLDFALNWCIINIIDAPNSCNTVWAANVDTQKPPESYYMRFEDYPFHHAMMQGYLKRESKFIYTIEGEEKEVYDDYLFSQTEFSRTPKEAQEASRAMEKYVCSFTFSNFGGLQTVGSEPLSESNLDILERFGKVFDLTYTRFNDLLIAEEQAREARIETALERVRSRTMAMQHSDELAEASHLLDKEVRGLGIKTWGCAFNIYRENDAIEWFGNEAGLLPTYTVPREGIFKEYYERGQQGESLHVKEIAGEQCIAHYEYMSTLPVVGDVLRQLKETNGSFPSYQIDHVAYFKYGYLLFITREAVPEAYDIFKRFAKVFEQTYTRFLDLQLKEEQAVKLVAEKRRLERTLTDLQATQQQLVHAEKMASLGELTAGIAHEIQNPLNFVNNFSDVSRELLEEMIDELKKGDTEEANAIARDVIQNLEKIVHHGKRADSIVKGMLQHSRSGDGKKAPTDLNALADEYLRLAYHGLRAKDKSFNASIETEFDEQVGKVDVIPQDIGRVLLNLITNAFHAVGERMSSEGRGYQPTVWVKTRKTAEGVELSVQDNGGGIPAAIQDKIFQPFFTTKPTGEGTGLGLSMSYDIVSKGHGGDLQMQVSEKEGTVFTIVLPIKKDGA